MVYIQDCSACEVSSISEVGRRHHVLRVVHLLRKFWDSYCAEVVSPTAGQGSKADHEEVESRERNHVDSQFAEIRVELTREAKTSRDTGHDGRDKVVQIAIGRVIELQSSVADVVECLGISAHAG